MTDPHDYKAWAEAGGLEEELAEWKARPPWFIDEVAAALSLIPEEDDGAFDGPAWTEIRDLRPPGYKPGPTREERLDRHHARLPPISELLTPKQYTDAVRVSQAYDALASRVPVERRVELNQKRDAEAAEAHRQKLYDDALRDRDWRTLKLRTFSKYIDPTWVEDLMQAERNLFPSTTTTTPSPSAPYSWIGQGFDVLDASAKPEARQFLVGDLIRERATTLLVGDYASHKSNLQLAMGLCVALGRDFAGLTTLQRPVRLVCQDQARERILEVLHGLLAYYGQPEAAMFEVFSYPEPPLALSGNNLSGLDEMLEGLHQPLILVDSLSACAGTTDENGPEMAQAVRHLDALRSRHKATAICTHHTPHGQDRSRGNRLIVAAVEYSLLVKRERKPDVDVVTFKPEKMGSAPLGKLVLKFGYRSYEGEPLMSLAWFDRASTSEAASERVHDDAEDLLRYVQAHPGCKAWDVRQPKKDGGLGLGWKTDKIRTAAALLLEQGRIALALGGGWQVPD